MNVPKIARPIVLVIGFLLVACGWSNSKTAAAAKGAADLAACVAEKFIANPNVTPEEIAAGCGPLAVEDARKVLVSVKKVAGTRVGASPCGSTAPSASGSK